MTNATNRQVRLAARPRGCPTAEVWDHTEEPVAEPGAGEVLVRVLLLSLDPAMRGWMNEGASYIPPVEIGEVMRAGGVGRRWSPRDDERFAEGDHVSGVLGVQEYALSAGRRAAEGRRRRRAARRPTSARSA